MKTSLLPLLLLSGAAFCAWSDPKPLAVAYYNVGCGADSGKAILLADFANNTDESYVLKSGSPIFPQAAALIERSVADQVPAQLFTRATGPRVSFSYAGDDGTCHTKSWIEIIGVALDKK